MYMFLIPLLLGFGLNSASAFTAAYSRCWGERGGRLASLLLRNVFGIPVWVIGLALVNGQTGKSGKKYRIKCEGQSSNDR
jgi:hypothetical protein